MFNPPDNLSASDRTVLRAARMAVQHHPAIPPVRPASVVPATISRFISTRFVQNIASGRP